LSNLSRDTEQYQKYSLNFVWAHSAVALQHLYEKPDKILLIIHLKEWYWKFYQNWRFAFKSEFLEIMLLMADSTHYHRQVLVQN